MQQNDRSLADGGAGGRVDRQLRERELRVLLLEAHAAGHKHAGPDLGRQHAAAAAGRE